VVELLLGGLGGELPAHGCHVQVPESGGVGHSVGDGQQRQGSEGFLGTTGAGVREGIVVIAYTLTIAHRNDAVD
jgi:hypothetical protein